MSLAFCDDIISPRFIFAPLYEIIRLPAQKGTDRREFCDENYLHIV